MMLSDELCFADLIGEAWKLYNSRRGVIKSPTDD
jgi:hypothetical protein